MLKKIMFIAGMSIMAVPQAEALSAGDAFKVLNTLESGYETMKEYYAYDKDYNKISDARVRRNIQNACEDGCNRFTCKQSKVREACVTFCPSSALPNCKRQGNNSKAEARAAELKAAARRDLGLDKPLTQLPPKPLTLEEQQKAEQVNAQTQRMLKGFGVNMPATTNAQ